MKLISITQKEFDNLPKSAKMLCYETNYAHKFALLQIDENEPIALCWRSELIKPQLIDSDTNSMLWIGIDQQLLAINKETSSVALSLQLPTNFIQFSESDEAILAMTESEVFAFNLNGSIRSWNILPEIPDSISVQNNTATVHLIDDQIINIAF